MLKRLSIKNIALIEQMSIEFDDKLNILSGETGAGKSIIVDSLFLLLGAKYDKLMLSYGADFGFVEGEFEVNELSKQLLDQALLEHDATIVVKRRFDKDGKNDIRLNGQAITQGMLKSIMGALVDIYGQNQHLTLLQQEQQLLLIEYFNRECIKLRVSVASLFIEYKEIKKQINALGDLKTRQRELENIKYEIKEIEDINAQEDEENIIIAKRRELLAGDKIKTVLESVANELCDNEQNISGLLSEIKGHLSQVKDNKLCLELFSRVEALKIEIDDIGYSARVAVDSIDNGLVEIEKLEKRLEKVRRIVRKYGDKKQCDEYLKDIKARFELLNDADNIGQKLDKQLVEKKKQVYNDALQLSKARRVGAVRLQKAILSELDELGMQASKFEVVFDDIPTIEECDKRIGSDGFDSVEYFLSTNKGQPIKPLSKIISGGEMSRFMLAIKVIVAQIESIDTLIFDEIDTGISGVIGQAVGAKLAKISRQKQVLCVSHLAQIVAMADKNWLITKKDINEKTVTSIVELLSNQKIKEVARLSGGQATDTALAAAKEIILNCEKYKTELT